MLVKLALVAVVIFSTQSLAQTVDPVVPMRVDLRRGSTCTGSVAYSLPLTNVTLKQRLGDAGRVLPLVVPCARIDAIDTLLPLPSTAAGALSVQTLEVILYRRVDGTCRADLRRELTPTNASVLAVRGSVTVDQQLPSVTCTRIDQALVGAQVTKNAPEILSWPSGVVALPLSVEP